MKINIFTSKYLNLLNIQKLTYLHRKYTDLQVNKNIYLTTLVFAR